jgi:hypothetical protein
MRPWIAFVCATEEALMSKRQPRAPVASAPVPAPEAEITATLNHWYDLFREVMTAEAGQRVLQHFLRRKLGSNDPEAFGIVLWLARQGHRAAWLAAKDYVRDALNYEPVISAQVRAYAIELFDLPEPAAPPTKGETVDNLVRDIGIRLMVERAAERWPFLPRLNSTERRNSVAFYVAAVLTSRGIPVGERQVRRLCQGRGDFALKLSAFLLAERG